MQAPEPETPADSVYYHCAYDHGISAAARALSLPLRAITQRINTYSYFALACFRGGSGRALSHR